MTNTPSRRALALAASLVLGAGGSLSLLLAAPAGAATAPVDLGTAGAFAVLGASTVTNTGPSVVTGDLGLSPGTSVTGFPPGLVLGTPHVTDAVAAQAQADTTTAYASAAGRSTDVTVTADLASQLLAPGVYSGTTLALNGTVTLDGGNDPDAVFVLRSGSTLITGSNSSVALVRGAQACNVFWQVASSATLGTGTSFSGTVLALTSITADTGATVTGRLLARTGAVTLDSNAVTRPSCLAAAPAPVPAPASPSATASTAPASAPSSSAGPTSPAPSASAAASAAASAPSVAPSTAGPAAPASPAAPVAGASTAPAAPPSAPAAAGPGVAGPATPPAVTDQGITGGPLDSPPTPSVPSLPRTGADTGTAALLGLAAVLLGALLVLAAHDPARARHQRPWARSRSTTA